MSWHAGARRVPVYALRSIRLDHCPSLGELACRHKSRSIRADEPDRDRDGPVGQDSNFTPKVYAKEMERRDGEPERLKVRVEGGFAPPWEEPVDAQAAA